MTPFSPLNDVPATDPGLDFGTYAETLADFLRKADPPQLTIGIFGGYGSGKTTLLEAIEKELEPDARGTPPLYTVRFNAWRHDHERNLFLPFLAALSQNQNIVRSGKQKESLLDSIRALAFGFSMKFPVFEFSSEKAILRYEQLQEQKRAEFHKLLANYMDVQRVLRGLTHDGNDVTQKIVVFVDDLDRCFPMKALRLLESLKVFTETTGFMFVLGLDPGAVETYLERKYGSGFVTSHQYLEKMVQVPFWLPRRSQEDINEVMDQMLENFFAKNRDEDFLDQLREAWSKLKPYFPRNIRQTKRILNVLRAIRTANPHLDTTILLALLVLQVRWRKLYHLLHASPEEFDTYVLKAHCGSPLEDLRDLKKVYTDFIRPELRPLAEKVKPYLEHLGWPTRAKTGQENSGERQC